MEIIFYQKLYKLILDASGFGGKNSVFLNNTKVLNNTSVYDINGNQQEKKLILH